MRSATDGFGWRTICLERIPVERAQRASWIRAFGAATVPLGPVKKKGVHFGASAGRPDARRRHAAMPVRIVEECPQRRRPLAAMPLRAAARRPAGCVARSLHATEGMLVTRALPAGLGPQQSVHCIVRRALRVLPSAAQAQVTGLQIRDGKKLTAGVDIAWAASLQISHALEVLGADPDFLQ